MAQSPVLSFTSPLSPSMLKRRGPNIFQLLDDNGANKRGIQNAVPTLRGVQNTAQGNGGRVMILCFDGSGDKFGTNSNVVRFVRSIRKDGWTKQIVYYQPGAESYKNTTFFKRIMYALAFNVDAIFAVDLDDRIKRGYKFIIQNFQPGDKICLFGFSTGAHIARALAGMIHKVGILPKESIEQLDSAFNIYRATGVNGYKLSQEFKRTFTAKENSDVSVDFVGAWDTVSSTGIIPTTHPYTSVNYAVKKFRHALSLDECRGTIWPNLWREATLDRENELDVDEKFPDIETCIESHGGPSRDDFVYQPPSRDYTDVKEVWFAGTHTDVGGGSYDATHAKSLSSIPLRWMIKECISCETEIIFDLDYLRDDLQFDFDDLVKEVENEMAKKNISNPADRVRGYEELVKYRDNQIEGDAPKSLVHETRPERKTGLRPFRLGALFDFWWFWCLLEIIPMPYTYQDSEGNRVRRRMWTFGRGRYIPVYNKKALVHKTVGDLIDKGIGTVGDKKYKPWAHNWDHLEKQHMIEYVS